MNPLLSEDEQKEAEDTPLGEDKGGAGAEIMKDSSSKKSKKSGKAEV